MNAQIDLPEKFAVIYLTDNLEDAGVYFRMMEDDGNNPIVYKVQLDEKAVSKDPGDKTAFCYPHDIAPEQLSRN